MSKRPRPASEEELKQPRVVVLHQSDVSDEQEVWKRILREDESDVAEAALEWTRKMFGLKLKRCTLCREECLGRVCPCGLRYCSKNCQLLHWGKHKHECSWVLEKLDKQCDGCGVVSAFNKCVLCAKSFCSRKCQMKNCPQHNHSNTVYEEVYEEKLSSPFLGPLNKNYSELLCGS